jgi:hypothetical protein
MTRLTKKHTTRAEDRIPPAKNDATTPIVVPQNGRKFTFSDHLRHLHEHAGDIPATLDEFGRCARCVSRGWFKLVS